MTHDALEALIRRLRRIPIARGAQPAACDAHEHAVERLIPHRPPYLLLDALTGVDRERRIVVGTRWIDPADPILAGHFPGVPVYPGALQSEAISQLGLCLMGLLEPQEPVNARALRVHHAQYVAEVLPGAHLTLMAELIDRDSLTATVAGQIYEGEALKSFTIMEAYLVA